MCGLLARPRPLPPRGSALLRATRRYPRASLPFPAPTCANPRVRQTFWFAVAYAVLGVTCAAFTLETWAIKHSSAATCALFMCLDPPLTALVSFVALHETCTWISVVGGGIVVSGWCNSARGPGAP